MAASAGGLIITESSDHTLHNFAIAGLLSAVATMASLWLAGRIRVAVEDNGIRPSCQLE